MQNAFLDKHARILLRQIVLRRGRRETGQITSGKLAHVCQVARHSSSGSHRRTHKMCTSSGALAAFKVPVRCRSTTFTW